MRVKIINRVATPQYVDGLPERGFTPVGATRYFAASPFMLYGRDGLGGNVGENLRRSEVAGNIFFEIELDKNDIGLIGRKVLRVSHAAGDFTATALTQTFTSETPFPVGARFVGGLVRISELITNSDADWTASTITVTATGPVSLRAALACDSATPDTAGDFALSAAYAGLALDGLYLNALFTNVGNDANQAENTAGEFLVEVLYTVQ